MHYIQYILFFVWRFLHSSVFHIGLAMEHEQHQKYPCTNETKNLKKSLENACGVVFFFFFIESKQSNQLISAFM